LISALAFILVIQDAALLDIPLKVDLPVLYEEDGKEVLRFSELFCQHELLLGHKKDKRHQKRRVLRGELM
jgi:4-alpha-glucanotransferase